MLLEVGAFFGAMQAVYWADEASNSVDFAYEADWANVRARLITLEAWHLDDNHYETNAWRHPVQGGVNYLFARSNGFSALESYAVSLTQSAAWELLGEYREDVSVNDIVLTPRAGSVLGETAWQLGLFFLRGERRWPYQVIGNAATGGKGVLDWLDGVDPIRPRVGPLGLPADVVHRFEATVTGGRWVVGGEARALLRTAIGAELILIPDFDRPGTARQLYAAPAYSELRVEATRADETMTDLRILARVGITSWHRKALHAGCGYNLLFGIGSAYEYGQHVGAGRATRSTRDQIALGHIGGGSALDDVHREAAARGLLVLALDHVGAGLAHGGDDLVERDLVVDCRRPQRERAALMAFTAPIALRSMHGTCTSPPMGSQVRPRLCSMPISAAFSTCSACRPAPRRAPAAAIEHATPTSPWQPTSAPEIDAFSLYSAADRGGGEQEAHHARRRRRRGRSAGSSAAPPG
jgi:uncharacterized protein (DUF1330 family)